MIILLSVVVLLVGALLIIPVFFKSDILRLIERQSAKYIKSQLTIGDVSLSMFKRFPNLNVIVSDVMISSSLEGKLDTLVYMPRFDASVNLKSLVSGDEILVNRILIDGGHIGLKVDAEGKANWDILISSDSEPEQTTEAAAEEAEKADRPITFNDIQLRQLAVKYQDIPLGVEASIESTNLNVQGNFSEGNTRLDVGLKLQHTTFSYENTVWLNRMDLSWNAVVGANLKTSVFNITESTLSLNDLLLNLTGSIGISDEKYDLDLKLNAPDTQFESILALLPAAMKKEMDGMKTAGAFQFNASVNGAYYEDHLPGFDLLLDIRDGSLRYPGMPESIDQINLKLSVNNPGGAVALTEIDLSNLAFRIAGNPFNMRLHLSNPEDLVFKGGMNGTIDFEKLKNALPLEEITLNGKITANLDVNGKYEYIEKEQYEKITANGKLSVNDIFFKNNDYPDGISLPTGEITLTPSNLKLDNIQVGYKSSDLALQGSVSNYLPYLFRDQKLKGHFSLTSNNLNLNEFMTSTTDSTATTNSEEVAEIIEVPKNIELTLKTGIQTLLFDELTVKDISGDIQLSNGIAALKNLKMQLLKGSITMNGSYSTVNPKVPAVDFSLRAENIDVEEAYHSFSFIQESVPIAMNCSGALAAAMTFQSVLAQDMSLIMNTVNGNGEIETNSLLINDNPTLSKLSGVLKNEELNRISISQLKIKFNIKDGHITLEPFTTKLAGQPTTISGKQTPEGDLDYTISMNVDRKYFGKDIEKVLTAIPGSSDIKNLDIDVKIGGTLDSPTVSPDLSKALKSIEKAASKELKNNLLKGLENLLKKEE